MYEYVKGELAEVTPIYAIVDAGGVGYYVNISLQTFSVIENMTEVKLYVHFIVREDVQLLYGFVSKTERELFRQLITVSGVGGNTARMILSTYSPRELQSIIYTENATLLKNVKGLGLKTAQKIIVELSGKIALIGLEGGDVALPSVVGGEVYDQTLSAMTMLGFTKSAADKAIKRVLKDNPSVGVEEAVRLSLKNL